MNLNLLPLCTSSFCLIQTVNTSGVQTREEDRSRHGGVQRETRFIIIRSLPTQKRTRVAIKTYDVSGVGGSFSRRGTTRVHTLRSERVGVHAEIATPDDPIKRW